MTIPAIAEPERGQNRNTLKKSRTELKPKVRADQRAGGYIRAGRTEPTKGALCLWKHRTEPRAKYEKMPEGRTQLRSVQAHWPRCRTEPG